MLATGALMATSATADTGQLVDVTAEAGLGYVQWDCDGCPRAGSDTYLITGGAAAGDFDRDGWVDLLLTRIDAPNLLFMNRSDGTFSEEGQERGVGIVTRSNGVATADVDGDGDLDLYVTTVDESRNYLFLNDGTGHFVERAVEWGVEASGEGTPTVYRSCTSAAFADVDGDGWLDLHTGEWRSLLVDNSRLYRNTGAGGFEDVTASAGVAIPDSWAFTSRFADVDGDGWPDLLIAADFGTSRLFLNDGDGTFTDVTETSGTGRDENGMGAAVGDVDDDGDLDWFVTAIYDPDDTCADQPCAWSDSGNRLYRNDGNGLFEDATDAAGVRDGYWGWGAVFFDIDNDGDLDLAQANGWDLPHSMLEERFAEDPMRLWINDGTGVFTERSVDWGVIEERSSRGVLTLDYDRDGDLDLLVVHNGSTPALLRNDTEPGSGWLRVELVGVRTNRFGIGARVELTREAGGPTRMREMAASSNYLAQDEPIVHFGLGRSGAPVAELRVSWPLTGYEQRLTEVAPNQTLVVRETQGTGDRDADLDIDLLDHAALVPCLGGPGSAVAGACVDFDLDLDGDVDLTDYARFQRRFTGE